MPVNKYNESSKQLSGEANLRTTGRPGLEERDPILPPGKTETAELRFPYESMLFIINSCGPLNCA
jgi:hypothetical protein